MPDTKAVGAQSWGNYRVSVAHIEQQTAYDPLSNVPQSVQLPIDVRYDRLAL